MASHIGVPSTIGLAIQTTQKYQYSWDMFGAILKVRTGNTGISNLGTKVHRLCKRLHLTESLDDLHLIWLVPGLNMKVIRENINEPLSGLKDPLP